MGYEEQRINYICINLIYMQENLKEENAKFISNLKYLFEIFQSKNEFSFVC